MALLLRTARKYLAEIKRATSLRSYDLREELVLWDFRKEETMQHWDCICDRDVKGNSTAALEPNGRGGSIELYYFSQLQFLHMQVLGPYSMDV